MASAEDTEDRLICILRPTATGHPQYSTPAPLAVRLSPSSNRLVRRQDPRWWPQWLSACLAGYRRAIGHTGSACSNQCMPVHTYATTSCTSTTGHVSTRHNHCVLSTCQTHETLFSRHTYSALALAHTAPPSPTLAILCGSSGSGVNRRPANPVPKQPSQPFNFLRPAASSATNLYFLTH